MALNDCLIGLQIEKPDHEVRITAGNGSFTVEVVKVIAHARVVHPIDGSESFLVEEQVELVATGTADTQEAAVLLAVGNVAQAAHI